MPNGKRCSALRCARPYRRRALPAGPIVCTFGTFLFGSASDLAEVLTVGQGTSGNGSFRTIHSWSVSPRQQCSSLTIGMDTAAADDLHSGYVHIKDLGYSPSGVRKVAVDLSDGEEVAIKLLQRGAQALQARSTVATSVEKDAVIHSQLHHPCIIGFKKIFLTNNTLGVVHEYASSGTLYDMVKNQGPFPESLARYFFQQLMQGVRYMHDRGVAHGDIKLKHLLIKTFNFTKAPAPVIKITHFAAAKEDTTATTGLPGAVQARSHSTHSGSRSHTQGSRGPFRNEDVLQSDKANDVWACGTVLYAMLTARPPAHSHGTPHNQAEGTSGGTSDAADMMDDTPGRLLWPPNVAVSDTCKNLLEAMLTPHVAERPTIHQVIDHPWYQQDLPRELQGNARGLAHCQAKKCQQPPEEVKELIRQARYASHMSGRMW